MGRNVSAEDKLEKRSDSGRVKDHNEEEEEEEEALSLCDLPLELNKDEMKSTETRFVRNHQEDSDFELWGGSLSPRSEMCSADDIFFQGQILPFRSSVSSDNGHSNNTDPNSNPKIRSLSRSESLGELTSFSSRSSSCNSRSQFSSSSSGSSRFSKPRIQNQFFTHSSPKPQIRNPNSSISCNINRNRKSTVWEFFRLGLVHNPEIELQELKARNSVSRNSSTSSSSNSNNSIRNSGKQSKQNLIEKRLLLSGCDCTVNSVKPVPFTRLKNEEIEEKKRKKNKERTKDRTVEWIKELSNSSFVEEEEGHKNSLGS